jgi:hypothetical protein
VVHDLVLSAVEDGSAKAFRRGSAKSLVSHQEQNVRLKTKRRTDQDVADDDQTPDAERWAQGGDDRSQETGARANDRDGADAKPTKTGEGQSRSLKESASVGRRRTSQDTCRR